MAGFIGRSQRIMGLGWPYQFYTLLQHFWHHPEFEASLDSFRVRVYNLIKGFVNYGDGIINLYIILFRYERITNDKLSAFDRAFARKVRMSVLL